MNGTIAIIVTLTTKIVEEFPKIMRPTNTTIVIRMLPTTVVTPPTTAITVNMISSNKANIANKVDAIREPIDTAAMRTKSTIVTMIKNIGPNIEMNPSCMTVQKFTGT